MKLAGMKAPAHEAANPRPKPKAAAPPPPAIRQVAQQRYSGAFAAPLNELSESAQRVRDVGARRQADANDYAAYVIGQQSKIAAAAHAADIGAVKQQVGVQLATAGAAAGLQQRLQAARAAQGISGAVPSQQLAGLTDDAQRNNLLLGAVTQRSADQAATNQGKAGFLAAAAQAQLMANQRAIAGDTFNQESDIRRERTSVLGQRENALSQERAAAEQAQADIAKARLAASEHAADRELRASIADASNNTRLETTNASIRARAREGRANRRVRLKTSTQMLNASGYISPAERARRNSDVRDVSSQRDQAVSLAKTYASGGIKSPDELRYAIRRQMKNAPPEVVDYALAAALGRRAHVSTAHGKSAARRYYDYVNRIKRGKS